TDLSLRVPRGTSLAVIGPNGAGKTVLFRALIGSIPFEGTIRWAPGTRIGYVPQKLDLERDLPVTGADFLRARAALARAPAPHVLCLSGERACMGAPRAILTPELLQEMYGAPTAYHVHEH